MVLEPIPALGAMMMALKMAKIDDPNVASAVSALDGKMKSSKSSDRQAWSGIYRDALALIPQVLAAQERIEQGRSSAQQRQVDKQRLSAADGALSSALQKAASEWQARIATQTRELWEKIQRSVEKLEVTGVDDEARGETIFRVEPTMLDAFWKWRAALEATWTSNNAQLVAVRANEALAAHVDLPAGQSFEVGPADIAPPASPTPRLKGFAVPTPGRFESLGATYKIVMSSVMGVSGVGFVASRVIGGSVAAVIPWAFGLVFVIALVVGIVSVPKKQRQAHARIHVRAAEQVHAEMLRELKEQLDRAAQQQLDAIRKHLAAEGRRWKTVLREAGGGGGEGSGAISVGIVGGLLPQDAGRLRGEWRAAIEGRIAEIEDRG